MRPSARLWGTARFVCPNLGRRWRCIGRMRIKRLPYVLALHLKRFKFVDNQYKKLSYRVAFPFELRLVNTVRPEASF